MNVKVALLILACGGAFLLVSLLWGLTRDWLAGWPGGLILLAVFVAAYIGQFIQSIPYLLEKERGHPPLGSVAKACFVVFIVFGIMWLAETL